MASTAIHLSDEITDLQKSLEHKMNLCNSMLEQTDIPILSYPDTPIYFLGTGQPNVGFNLNKRILDEGYYVNLGIFPAVSIKNTGLRFTITNHVSDEDIKGFVDALKYHYPKALEEEGKDINHVRKAFKLSPLDSVKLIEKAIEPSLRLEIYNDINQVDKDKWDLVMADKAGCTWDNMKMTQEAYSGNTKPEENAEMYYYLVFDEKNEVVCSTVFSLMLMKDDMFESAGKSIVVEQMRKENPYFLTSKTFFMGTMLTEGDHLFIDYNTEWKDALKLIFDHLNRELEGTNSNNIILRDFEHKNQELANFIYDEGFAKVNMPNSNIISDLKDQNLESFFESLSARSRRHIRNDVFKYESSLNTVIVKNLSFEGQKKAYELLLNVSRKNFAVNIFDYSLKLIQKMSESTNWEFIKITINKELVAVGFSHKIADNYYPVLVGIDYEYNINYKVYKQMLYQVVKRAIELKCDKVYFGLSADIEKRKFKAHQIEKVAYIYSRDNFNFEQLYNIRENEKIPA